MLTDKRYINHDTSVDYKSLSQKVRNSELLFAEVEYKGIEAIIKIDGEKSFRSLETDEAVVVLGYFVIQNAVVD